MEKTVKTSGADERTPSVPQYFTWINNTNEGATEKQTILNLNYFKWLQDTYGMQIQLYAWDAGNLDGASSTFETPDSPKIHQQYPNGYLPCVKKAKELGIRLGVWGGADGFGDTAEEETARKDLFVSLCRDFHFMEFKFDTVCRTLRPEKRKVFADMLKECRNYSPDLIVLNHRNDLGESEIYATTFLWEGVETYIDVLIRNTVTAPHHRACTLKRGLTPDLKRLTEDHGVCLSSCLDFFADELILQAFNRSLILAPEIYGNPWLLRDEEQAILARIYNLHRKYNEILTDGMVLPDSYGESPVSRGNAKTRLITLRNNTWETMRISVRLDTEISLAPCEKVCFASYFPYESFIGSYLYGELVTVEVAPFRSALFLAEEQNQFNKTERMLTNCAYLVQNDFEGQPMAVTLISANGKPIASVGKESGIFNSEPSTFNHSLMAPIFLGKMKEIPLPTNTEGLFEATCFRIDNDSLEAQSLKRAGATAIPEIQATRDVFFDQVSYLARGCESSVLFDGKPDTFFDGNTKCYETRINGGCLRVDCGERIDADRVEITYFEIDNPIREVQPQNVTEMAEISESLSDWKDAPLCSVTVSDEPVITPVVKYTVHNLEEHSGKRKVATYAINAPFQYFRLAEPFDRIYSICFYKNGEPIFLSNPHANNMQSHPKKRLFVKAQSASISLPDTLSDHHYLAIAIEGTHGYEGAYAAAMLDGKLIGCNDRAASFPVNNWEHIVSKSETGYTYYLPLTPDMAGKQMSVYTLQANENPITCDVYLCEWENRY